MASRAFVRATGPLVVPGTCAIKYCSPKTNRISKIVRLTNETALEERNRTIEVRKNRTIEVKDIIRNVSHKTCNAGRGMTLSSMPFPGDASLDAFDVAVVKPKLSRKAASENRPRECVFTFISRWRMVGW